MSKKAFSFLLLALFCLTASSIEVLKGPHECHHDKLDIKIETIDTGDEQNDGDRTLITYESIRILLDFSSKLNLSSLSLKPPLSYVFQLICHQDLYPNSSPSSRSKSPDFSS